MAPSSSRAGRTARAGLAVAMAAASAWAAAGGHGDATDERARATVEGLRRRTAGAADTTVAVATDLGSVYGLVGTSASLALMGRRRHAARVLAAGGIAWTLAQATKPLLARERPYEADGAERLVAEPAGSSWPSGHAAVAAAMTSALWPDLTRSGRLVAATLTAGVAASRLYVGVHHLTDVIGGIGLGIVSASALGDRPRR
jgi:undecaprenyl-diphosphatase